MIKIFILLDLVSCFEIIFSPSTLKRTEFRKPILDVVLFKLMIVRLEIMKSVMFAVLLMPKKIFFFARFKTSLIYFGFKVLKVS